MATVAGTAMGTSVAGMQRPVAEGRFTSTVYKLVREQKYEDVVRLLQQELLTNPTSRAALSLTAYAQYHLGNYDIAAQHYEQLTKHHNDHEDYKFYLAQSLYKAGEYESAYKITTTIESPELADKVLQLQSCIKYEEEDYATCRAHLEQCGADADTIVNRGCVHYQEGEYEKALQHFQDAMNMLSYQPDLAYNIALCYYRMKQYGPALKHIAEIIEKGVREHPELAVGSNNDGLDVRSVGNSNTLRESALIEAFNLKADIEYMMKNYEAAKEALTDMPPRAEEEVDPVTLHNQALMQMEDDPNAGFKKLTHLLRNVRGRASCVRGREGMGGGERGLKLLLCRLQLLALPPFYHRLCVPCLTRAYTSVEENSD